MIPHYCISVAMYMADKGLAGEKMQVQHPALMVLFVKNR